jgi:hypothetical protein
MLLDNLHFIINSFLKQIIMSEDSRLQNLMNYTIFHIGVYISLLGVILGAGLSDTLDPTFFKFPFICYLLAGVCGGVIASNIPEYVSYTEFACDRLRIIKMRTFKFNIWAHTEHVLFWIGTLWIAGTFIFNGTECFIKKVSGN